MNLSGIKHLIFDLGGVIIDLNPEATYTSMERLTGRPIDQWLSGLHESQLFTDYEQGFLSDSEFRDSVRQIAAVSLTDTEINKAWNAMLGAIPRRRIDKVVELGKTYQTFVLSNTNGIHVSAFNETLQLSTGKPTLDHFFNKVYFSHVMKMRKPETEIYQTVLGENNLNPREVLFLDDKEENLKGAEKLKIQTFLVPSPDSWLELF
ncbi:MAG: HAD family phosphatase [Imperialibacter sp.]|uniref:HAD family hydrolase n=1 Tax=Imperialibacter sp. TaxID=2038411 RepID=UPI0032EFFAB7